MPILKKPITRAEYVAGRVDKATADENKKESDRRIEAAEKLMSNNLPPTNELLSNVKEKEVSEFPYKSDDKTKFVRRTYSTGRSEVRRYDFYNTPSNNNDNSNTSPKEVTTTSKKEGILRRGYTNLNTLEANLLEKKKQFSNKDMKSTGYVVQQRITTRAALFGIGVIKGVGTPIIYPKETVKGIWQSVKNPKKAAINIYTEAKSNPFGTLGSFAGTGILFKAGGGITTAARNTKIKLTTDTVKANTYLESSSSNIIAKGGVAFPLTRGIKDSVKQFDYKLGGSYKSASASPIALKGSLFSKDIIVGKGTGKARSEGLYVAPYSQGSAYFLGVNRQSGYSFSILPKFNARPTLSVISASDKVRRIPKPVLKQGVDYENLYLQTQGVSGTGRIFITGNTERKFNPSLPAAFKTSEVEAVVPAGSILRKSGPDSLSFKFGQYRIPIKEYTLVKDGSSKFRPNISNPFMKYGKYDSSSGIYYTPKKNVSITGSASRLSSSSIKLGSSSASSVSKSFSSNNYSSRSIVLSKSFSSYNRKGNYGSSFKLSRSNNRSRDYDNNSYSSINSSNYYSNNSIKPVLDNKVKLPEQSKSKKSMIILDRRSPLRYGYSPTIEASLFNIRAASISRSAANSGLVVRPQLRGRT